MHHLVVRRSAALLLARQAAAGQPASTRTGIQRWASTEAGEEATATPTAEADAKQTEGRKNKAKVEAAEAVNLDADVEASASAQSSQNGTSQSENVYARGLTPELRRQRRAELARRGETEDIALDAEVASADPKPAQEEQARPPRRQQQQQQQQSGKKPARRRVDLRGGEGGRASYPGSSRTNDNGDDATAIVERPGSRSRSGGLGVDRSHNGPVRSDRPGGEYVLGASRGAGSGGASPRGTGARPGQPGLNTQRDPLVGFAAPSERSSGQRYGGYGGGDRNTSRFGGGGSGGKKSGGGPPRRRRIQRGTMAAAPMKPLPPPPSSVVNAQGRYIRARPLDAILDSTPPSASIPARQFASLSADIKAANLGGDGAAGKMSERLAGIARGDWKAFAAPVFRAQKHAASEKAGGAGSITQRSTKEEIMRRAREAMVANGSVGLGGKVTVVQKIESAV